MINKKTMTRRKIREKVLQILYAFEMTKDSIDAIKSEQLTGIEDKADELFAHRLIKLVMENEEYYDKLIKSIVDNWDIERIAILDHIIIKMCLSEFIYMEDIPTKVSMNEAIELAKNFSTKNSGKFVNGILDSILIRMRKNGEIKKSGKGMVGEADLKKIPKKNVRSGMKHGK